MYFLSFDVRYVLGITPFKDFFLKNITILFQSFDCFHFLRVRCLRIYIHRGFDICVSHDTLEHFEICFIFTKSRAKRVPDVVARKMENQYRASALPFRLNNFFGVVGFVYPFDCMVDYTRLMDNSILIAEDKSTHSISSLIL